MYKSAIIECLYFTNYICLSVFLCDQIGDREMKVKCLVLLDFFSWEKLKCVECTEKKKENFFQASEDGKNGQINWEPFERKAEMENRFRHVEGKKNEKYGFNCILSVKFWKNCLCTA